MPTDTMLREADRRAFKAHHSQGGAIKVKWDETAQTPIIKHITPQELYKDRE